MLNVLHESGAVLLSGRMLESLRTLTCARADDLPLNATSLLSYHHSTIMTTPSLHPIPRPQLFHTGAHSARRTPTPPDRAPTPPDGRGRQGLAVLFLSLLPPPTVSALCSLLMSVMSVP
eukprot:6193101-Pleurochrysis_carterae.AAC.1